MSKLLTMVDTTEGAGTIRAYTKTPDAVAGYGGQHNRFQNAGALFAAFPLSRHVLVVADSRDHPARAPGVVVVLDIERGNNTPDVAGWIRTEHHDFRVARPALYFNLSDGVRTMQELHAQGINDPEDYSVWAAHPNGRPELTRPGAFPGWVVTSEATQYLWSPRGLNVDVSVCSPAFFTVAAAAKPSPVVPPPSRPDPLSPWQHGWQAGFQTGYREGFNTAWRKAHGG